MPLDAATPMAPDPAAGTASNDGAAGSGVHAAWAVLSRLLPRSPLLPFGGDTAQTPLLLKAESLMPTGSFKIRGATYCIAQLRETQRARGVVAYSTGNHAQAVAKAARDAGVRAHIVMSPDAPAAKIDSTRRYGAEIVMAASSSNARRAAAEALAAETQATLIPPYEHPDVIAGQGTIGIELLAQLHGQVPAAVYVPVGGGGLLAGIALAIKSQSPRTRVIGVEPELEDDAARSFAGGTLFAANAPSNSMADAIKVQSLGTLNFALIKRYVDAIVTVSEAQIAQAMVDCFHANRLVVEPAGAVAVAAARLHARHTLPPGQAAGPVIAIVSGGNTTAAFLQHIQGMHP
jgi:threonine dehydratase